MTMFQFIKVKFKNAETREKKTNVTNYGFLKFLGQNDYCF